MREPEELATAPDYRWRRWWNQFWVHVSVVVFLVAALASQDFFFIPAIVTALVYWFVSRKVAEWDAAERGFDSPDLDTIMKTALRQRATDQTEDEATLASGLPIASKRDGGEQAPPLRPAGPNFGRAKIPAKKPVDLPRRRP